MTRLRTLYVLREDSKHANGITRPQVYIERTASGVIVYGVKVTARSLGRAREIAEREFAKLRTFAKGTDTEGTA